MSQRSIAMVAAILTATSFGCASMGGQSKPALGEPTSNSTLASSPHVHARNVRAPILKTEERYRDDMGFELVLKADEKGNVRAEAFDPQGKPVEVVTKPIESVVLCWPKEGTNAGGAFDPASNQCQRVSFISDGAFIKVGSASCTCYPCGTTMVCYGSTCH